MQHLQCEGAATQLVVRSDALTTLGMVSTDGLGGAPRHTFYGQSTADRAIDPANLPALPPAARVLQSGSYTLVVEPTGSALRALAALHAAGARLVVVTCGARGCEAWTKQSHSHVPAPRADAIDTSGAGDNFHVADHAPQRIVRSASPALCETARNRSKAVQKSAGISKYGSAPVGKTLNCQFARPSTITLPR